MSKDDAITCIEEDLTGLSKNAKPVLDANAHKLNDSDLARDALEWNTPKKTLAAGLHRLLEKEINNKCYSGPLLPDGESMHDHIFVDVEIHATGETITAEQQRQLFVVRALLESLQDSNGSTETNDNDTDDNDQEELEEHEYEENFEPGAGKTSEDKGAATMALA